MKMLDEDILDAIEAKPDEFSFVPKYVGVLRLVYAVLYFVGSLIILFKLNAAITILVILIYSLLEGEKGYREAKGNFIPKKYALYVLSIITNFVLICVAIYFFSIQFDYLPTDQLWKLILPFLLLTPLPIFIFYDVKHTRFISKK